MADVKPTEIEGQTGGIRKSPLLELYLVQRAALKRFLKARLGAEDEAEDLVQEMFFRLERAAIIDDLQNPLGYLYKMALNIARDHRRERQRTQLRDGHWAELHRDLDGAEPVADTPSVEAAYAAKQRLASIVAALDDLSPQCRRVFILHKFESLTHLEIAERLGIARSTVEKHMGTALKHLIKRLGRD